MSGNFVNDEHAFIAGYVVGELRRLGVNVMPEDDEDGNHTANMVITLDGGYRVRVEVLMPVMPPKRHEDT